VELNAPVVLENAHVRLEPLHARHAPDLVRAAEGLEHAWYTSVPAATPAAVDADIAQRLRWRDEGHMNPWAVLRDGVAVGTTTYCHIDLANRRPEVGYTWLSPSVQRTAVNSAAKLLLLAHAFDTCAAIAVELRTHWHNRTSRAAIERLGAKQDGVLRNHRVDADGVYRDTVVYSILPNEWPAVRRGLESRLARG
jgi:N-acetyltransferase